MIDNMQKYENYKEQQGRLNRAIKSQFYLEAIFIEYAILEDRTESLLTHLGVFNPEKHNTLARKLSRIKDLHRNKTGLVKKHVPLILLNEIDAWKNERNGLVHTLLKQSLHTEDLEKCAFNGQRLTKALSSKVNTVKRGLLRMEQK